MQILSLNSPTVSTREYGRHKWTLFSQPSEVTAGSTNLLLLPQLYPNGYTKHCPKTRLCIWSCLVFAEDFLHSRMLHLAGDWRSLHGTLGKLKHTSFHSHLAWTIRQQESTVHHDLLKLKEIINLYVFLSLWTYLCYHVFKQHESFLTSVHLISINQKNC